MTPLPVHRIRGYSSIISYMCAHAPLERNNPFFTAFRKELKTNGLSARAISLFRQGILAFYREKRRDLPWRDTTNPYHIYVSEIMLQQTQVGRVIRKYGEFIAAFPDFPSLAAAPLEDVLRVWQGMGYNRRAKSLKEVAERVMNEFHGSLPEDEALLITFPGIGKATASSIAAFAFHKPGVLLETNVRRVFIHFFFQDQENIKDRDILPLIEKTLDRSNPREWYHALMDYGAELKEEVQNPNRRSAAYARQSRFEGSDRQIRGMVLKIILGHGEMSEDDLIKAMEKEPQRVRRIVRDLVKEGFMAVKGSVLRIK